MGRAADKAGAGSDDVRAHYTAAQTFQLAGDLAHAESEYRQMLGLALCQTGNFRANQNDFPAAEKILSAALSVLPDDPEVRVDYAILQLRSQNFAEAKHQAEKAVQLSSENVRAQHALGKALFGLGEIEAAIPHLERAATLAPDFDIAYTLGSAYLRHKDPGKAQAVFDEMLGAGGPEAAPKLHALFAFAYHAAGEPDQAAAQFRKALALDPKFPQAHYYLGLDQLTRLDETGFPQAKSEFELEIKNYPNDYASHYLLGYILMQQHEQADAETHLLAAARIDPTRPDPFLYLGQLYTETNRPADAEPALRSAIRLATDVAHNNYQISRAHYLLGRLLTAQGHGEEATRELREYERLRNLAVGKVRDSRDRPAETGAEAMVGQAVNQVVGAPSARTNSESEKATAAYVDGLGGMIADAFNNLGVIAAQKRSFLEALEYFGNAARWSPEPETLRRNWGMAAFLAEKYDEAIPLLEKCVEKRPDDTRAQERLAVSYFITEKYAQSVKVCHSVAPEIAADAALAYACGVSMIKVGETASGIQLLKQVDATNPNSSDAHLLLGQAYADQGDVDTASAEFQRALDLAPQQKEIHFQYGLLMLKKGRLKEAQEQFRAELKLNPASRPARYHLALALLRDQHKEEAATLLGEVIREDPANADAYYQLGKLQIEREDVSEAVTNLEAAAKLAPDRSYIHYQLSLAYRRRGQRDDAAREMKLYETLKARDRGRSDAKSE
jgi:tetratricopeptide (TPR) repeat protein